MTQKGSYTERHSSIKNNVLKTKSEGPTKEKLSEPCIGESQDPLQRWATVNIN
jgi:hypothetical protein